MDTQQNHEILHDFSPRIRVYKDGRIERLINVPTVPPSYDPKTRVQSKDVIISPEVSARIYIPLPEKDHFPTEMTKLPLYIYFHGGAFCLNSSSSATVHNYLNSVVSHAKVIAVSANYRLAPEYPIPACYNDSWTVTQWTASHSGGSGPDPWLNRWADFGRVFLAGESAGANIAHQMMVRAGPGRYIGPGARVEGMLLIHPFFGDGGPDGLWNFLCPGTSGPLDPRINPAGDSARMGREVGCGRVLVCVDEEDWLKGRGVKYYEALKESGWEGEVGLVGTCGGGHVFHVSLKPASEEALKLVGWIASFVNKAK